MMTIAVFISLLQGDQLVKRTFLLNYNERAMSGCDCVSKYKDSLMDAEGELGVITDYMAVCSIYSAC
jgi:hypothetical protein